MITITMQEYERNYGNDPNFYIYEDEIGVVYVISRIDYTTVAVVRMD